MWLKLWMSEREVDEPSWIQMDRVAYLAKQADIFDGPRPRKRNGTALYIHGLDEGSSLNVDESPEQILSMLKAGSRHSMYVAKMAEGQSTTEEKRVAGSNGPEPAGPRPVPTPQPPDPPGESTWFTRGEEPPIQTRHRRPAAPPAPPLPPNTVGYERQPSAPNESTMRAPAIMIDDLRARVDILEGHLSEIDKALRAMQKRIADQALAREQTELDRLWKAIDGLSDRLTKRIGSLERHQKWNEQVLARTDKVLDWIRGLR